MFDDIYNRWFTNNITESDLVELLIEWNKEFGNKKATPESAVAFLRSVQTDYKQLFDNIITKLAVKRNYFWYELYNKDGYLIKRYK